MLRAGYNYDETVSTLRYANRAKNIKNKPKINEDPKDAMLREFQDEIARLKAQLQGKGTYDENGEWQGADSASRGAAAPSRHRRESSPGWRRHETAVASMNLPCPAGEQKEYKEVEKIVHKEVIKEVTVGVSEEELSKVRDRVGTNRGASWTLDAIEQTQRWGQRRVDGVESTRHRADAVTGTTSRRWPHRSTPRPSGKRRRLGNGPSASWPPS